MRSLCISLSLWLILSPFAAAQPATGATKKIRILSSHGWSLSIGIDDGAVARALKEDPERVKVERIDYEILYYSNGRYLLHAPKGLKKEHLPKKEAAPVRQEEIEVIESARSITIVRPKTYYPLFEKLLEYSRDRADNDAYVPGVRRQTALLQEFRSPTGDALEMLTLGGVPPGDAWIETFSSVYELLVEGKTVQVTIIGKPAGGFSRVKPALEKRLREIKEPALLINTGGIGIDTDFGASQYGMLDAMLQTGLRLITFSPGDIKYSWAGLLKRATEGPEQDRPILLASNLKPKEPTDARPVKRSHVAVIDGIRIGVLSLLPPRANALLTQNALPWTIEEPAAAARALIMDLRVKEKVDLIAAVSHLNSEENARLLDEAPGIDILLGTTLGERATRRRNSVELTGWGSEKHARPALIASPSEFSFDEIALEFQPGPEGQELVHIEELSGPTGPYRNFDPELAALEEHLFGFFNQGRTPVLPDPRLLWPRSKRLKLTYDAPEFWNLAAEAARRRAGAEIALLRVRSTNNNNIPGELTESFVSSWLGARERLVRVTLPGSALRALLPRVVYPEFPVFDFSERMRDSELRLAQAGLERRGRVSQLPLGEQELYTVVTTEDLLKHAEQLPPLNEAVKTRPLNLTLDQVVMDFLHERRRRLDQDAREFFHQRVKSDFGGTVAAAAKGLDKDALDRTLGEQKARAAADARTAYEKDIRWMAEGLAPEHPVWRLDLRELSAYFANTQLNNEGPFSQVRDARIQSVNQVYGLGSAKVFSELYVEKWRWDVGVSAKYGKVIIKPRGILPIENKTQDQFLAETELRHRSLRLESGGAGYSLGPFINASYDTEFTENPGLPIRRLIWLKPGVKLFEGTRLRELRVSGVSQTDRSTPREKTQFGYEVGYEFVSPLPRSKIVFQSKGSYLQFAPHHMDTLSDLRRQLNLSGKLRVPVYDNLQLNPFVDFYLFDSKVLPERGYNILFGVALEFSHLWKPVY